MLVSNMFSLSVMRLVINLVYEKSHQTLAYLLVALLPKTFIRTPRETSKKAPRVTTFRTAVLPLPSLVLS